MKYLLTAALALFATTASADLCDDMGDIGSGVLLSRIEGVPIDFWLDQVDPDGHNVDWILSILIAAYEVDIPHDKRERLLAPWAFSLTVEQTCRENSGPLM